MSATLLYTLANIITFIRWSLLVIVLFQTNLSVQSILFLIILFLDGVDGWAARKLRHESTFGAYFDMELDSTSILILTLLIVNQSQIGPYLLLVGLARPLMVILKRIFWNQVQAERRSNWGRITYIFVFLTLLAELYFNRLWSKFLCLASSIILIYSFYLDCLFFEKVKYYKLKEVSK